MVVPKRSDIMIPRLLPSLPDWPVVCFRQRGCVDNLLHDNRPYHVLLFVQHGQAIVINLQNENPTILSLSPGEVLVCPPHTPWHIKAESSESALDIWAIAFDQRTLTLPKPIVEALSIEPEPLRPGVSVQKQVLRLITAMQKEVVRCDWASPLLLRSLLEQILLLLLRHDLELQQSEPEPTTHVRLENRIDTVQEFIEAHLAEEITVSQLAKLVDISPRHLSATFKKKTGMTVLAYLNLRRVEKAKELLLTTHRSITDIAFDVGFKSLGQFYEHFKRYTGMIPSIYRKTKTSYAASTNKTPTSVAGWRIAFSGPDVTVELDTKTFFCTGPSIFIESHTARSVGIYRDLVVAQQTRYRLQVAYRQEDTILSDLLVRIQFRDQTNKPTAPHLEINGAQGQAMCEGWYVLHTEFQIPPNVHNIRLELLLWRTEGRVWWDDVWLFQKVNWKNDADG